MATAKPTAVVTSASAIPAETDAKPPPPPLEGSAICWKAVMMPKTVPKRPTKGADEAIVASTAKPLCSAAISRFFVRSMERPISWTRISISVGSAVLAPRPSIPRTRSLMAGPITRATGASLNRWSSPTASLRRPGEVTSGCSAPM